MFVDSTIANLNNPIGGCYENATAMNGYSTYSLGGGGPRKGQAWIYVTTSVRLLLSQNQHPAMFESNVYLRVRRVCKNACVQVYRNTSCRDGAWSTAFILEAL